MGEDDYNIKYKVLSSIKDNENLIQDSLFKTIGGKIHQRNEGEI